METAALYALAEVKGYPILCIARVTNSVAQLENDIEKGDQAGNPAFVALITTLVDLWSMSAVRNAGQTLKSIEGCSEDDRSDVAANRR